MKSTRINSSLATWPYTFAIVAVPLVVAGCTLLDVGDNTSAGDLIPSQDAIEFPDPTAFSRSNYPDDPISLTSISVRNDSLVVDVSYSGGCADHVVRLVASNYWLESIPVQLYAILAHDDPDDPCDAIVSETVAYDLKPLRDNYFDAYGPPGDVIIRVFADSTTSQSIRYQF